MAPEVRKQIKERITTKRTPANGAMMIEEDVTALWAGLPMRKDELIVANHTEELRAVDVLLDEKIGAEGVLDQSSQIICIRKDIW